MAILRFLRNLSPRTLRIIFSISAAAVLTVAVLNFMQRMVYRVTSNDQCRWVEIPEQPDRLIILDVLPGGVTDRAGIVDGDTLLQIAGKTFLTSGQAQMMINQYGVGDTVTYTISRGGRVFDTGVEIIKAFNLPYLAFFLLGLGFLFVGYVVFMTKPDGTLQRKFGRYSLAAMLFFGFYGFLQSIPENPLLANVLNASTIAGYLFSSPLFVNFFLYYPLKKKITENRWAMRSLYLIPVFNIGVVILVQVFQWPTWTVFLMFAVPYACFVTGFIIFCHSYFTRVRSGQKDALRPILIGMIIGGAVVVYVISLQIINPFSFYFTPWLYIPGILVLVIPVTFGYSIFRYRLMDIDLIIKRSLIYGVITASIASIYLTIVYGAGSLIGQFLGTEENRLMNIVAFILIALAFDPIKKRTQSWVDRTYYQERLNYQKALLEFSQELPRQMNLEQIMESIVGRISSTMHIQHVAVLVCDGGNGTCAATEAVDRADCGTEAVQKGLLGLLRERKRPISLAFMGEDRDADTMTETEKNVIRRMGIILSVPILLQDRLLGCIGVGPKLSGRIYSQEDHDLLSTVAGQAAIAIENARLHTSEIEKEKMEKELAMARRIQTGLFPKSTPAIGHLDIAGTSIPALSVGGDYYDYIMLDDTRLLVVVADVSGKGMSAALYMSKIQGMIQLAAHMYSSPRDMLVHVNRRLYDGIERNSFITMILGLFDVEHGTVTICRAGHNKALICADGTSQFLDAEGIGLGLERGPVFEEHLQEVRYSLKPGSLFLFYSDGLTEAMDSSGEQFGEEALQRLTEQNGALKAEALQKLILEAVGNFRKTAEQHDDITTLIVKYV